MNKEISFERAIYAYKCYYQDKYNMSDVEYPDVASSYNDSLSRADNFRRSAGDDISNEVLPADRQRVGDQLDEMLASFQPSDMPLVPPANAITPQQMLSETVLPNPRDREIAERQMQGIGSLV